MKKNKKEEKSNLITSVMDKKIEVSVKDIFIDRIKMFLMLVFALALFLMDNNLNIITAYGTNIKVTIFGEWMTYATNMFWTGFIALSLIMFIMSIRSLITRKLKISPFDVLLSAMGVLGLMIILSGGLLGFWHQSSFLIPIFGYNITRVSYYHIGIGLEILTLFYFAMTK